MKILFLTNLLPYPLDNGGKIKTYNILKALCIEHTVDLLCFYENESDKKYVNNVKELCNEVYCFNKKLTTRKNKKEMICKAFLSLFSKYSFGLYKFQDKGMQKKIDEIKDNYDCIYIDHLQLAVYLDNFKNTNHKIILDQHNCESVIMKRYYDEEKNIIKKMFFKFEYLKLKKFEKNTMKIVDRIITLSKEDMNEMISIADISEERFLILPIIIHNDFTKDISKVSLENKIKVMFLGTLTWYPNVQGIKWFLDEVLEELNDDIELYIVGKDPDNDIIEKSKKFNNIKITGYVDDVNDYFDLCDLMIVPIFIGSGMRVKILEGLAKGIPIVSTSIGCEGIQVEHNKSILIANNKQEFIENIYKLKKSELYKDISENGKNMFNELYSFEALNKKINDSVNNL